MYLIFVYSLCSTNPLYDIINIPETISVTNSNASNLKCRQEIYTHAIRHAYGENFDLKNGCVLAARNEDVDELNAFALERFSGPVVDVYNADSAREGQEQLYPVEFFKTLQPNGFPLHKLRLKVF